jgi:hypothetical protein
MPSTGMSVITWFAFLSALSALSAGLAGSRGLRLPFLSTKTAHYATYVCKKAAGAGYVCKKAAGAGYVCKKAAGAGYVCKKAAGAGYVCKKAAGAGCVCKKAAGAGHAGHAHGATPRTASASLAASAGPDMTEGATTQRTPSVSMRPARAASALSITIVAA